MKWETGKKTKTKTRTKCWFFEINEIDKSLDKMIRYKTQITNIWNKKGKTTIYPRNTERIIRKY